MKRIELDIPDVEVLTPSIFGDDRGHFFESFRASWLPEHEFVQDNQSSSVRGTLRGLHYQLANPQGKLVRVVRGTVFDVAVDIRKSSPFFGKWVARTLTSENHEMLWVPPGFAHGFLVLSETAEFVYKCTDYYAPGDEYGIRWDDPALSIDWPMNPEEIILSGKDRDAAYLADARVFS